MGEGLGRIAAGGVAAALAALCVPSIALASFGGPDLFGYTFIDEHEAAGPDYDWLDTPTDHQLPDNG